jgi:hypothetical protein
VAERGDIATRFAKGNPHARRGNGAGIGGQAKGKGHPPFADSQEAAAIQALHTPERAKSKEERAAALLEHLERLAVTAERENDQIAATVAALNRLEGMPIARTVTAHVLDPNSLSDADLAAIAAGSGGAAASSPGDKA